MNIKINLWQSSLIIVFIDVQCGLDSLTPDKIVRITLYPILNLRVVILSPMCLVGR